MALRSALSLLALATPALALRVQPAARTEHLDRRTLLTAVTNLGAAMLVTVPRGVLAEVKGPNANMPRDERGVNDVLRGAGFPPMKGVNGLKPLVQYVGFASPANIDGQKARDRPYKGTLLVRFLYPSSWIVETPTITENGEAGKIAANNYQKGDLAEFVALTLPNGKRLGDLGADFYKGWLSSQARPARHRVGTGLRPATARRARTRVLRRCLCRRCRATSTRTSRLRRSRR